MPYASIEDLPKEIRDALPVKAQSMFRRVVNAAISDGDSESSAFSQAWGAVKNIWEKNEDGEWVEKSEPTAGDVHVNTPLGGNKKDEEVSLVKVDRENRIVYGWASVVVNKGEVVVDTQGDIIEPAELVKATTDFMIKERQTHVMHEGEQRGIVVHSFPLVGSIAKSLGIECDKEGWIVGVQVSDDVMKRVDSGELKAFSIGGAARRVKV